MPIPFDPSMKRKSRQRANLHQRLMERIVRSKQKWHTPEELSDALGETPQMMLATCKQLSENEFLIGKRDAKFKLNKDHPEVASVISYAKQSHQKHLTDDLLVAFFMDHATSLLAEYHKPSVVIEEPAPVETLEQPEKEAPKVAPPEKPKVSKLEQNIDMLKSEFHEFAKEHLSHDQNRVRMGVRRLHQDYDAFLKQSLREKERRAETERLICNAAELVEISLGGIIYTDAESIKKRISKLSDSQVARILDVVIKRTKQFT